jgi:hypothetical protein
MERIKKFLLDETATAEATSTVVMIAAVGLLLAGGLTVWYGGISNFFTSASDSVNQGATGWPIPGAGS